MSNIGGGSITERRIAELEDEMKGPMKSLELTQKALDELLAKTDRTAKDERDIELRELTIEEKTREIAEIQDKIDVLKGK